MLDATLGSAHLARPSFAQGVPALSTIVLRWGAADARTEVVRRAVGQERLTRFHPRRLPRSRARAGLSVTSAVAMASGSPRAAAELHPASIDLPQPLDRSEMWQIGAPERPSYFLGTRSGRGEAVGKKLKRLSSARDFSNKVVQRF